jgi:cell division protein FtsB
MTGLSTDGQAIVDAVSKKVISQFGKVESANRRSYRYLAQRITEQNREIRQLKKWRDSVEQRLTELTDDDC